MNAREKLTLIGKLCASENTQENLSAIARYVDAHPEKALKEFKTRSESESSCDLFSNSGSWCKKIDQFRNSGSWCKKVDHPEIFLNTGSWNKQVDSLPFAR